MFVLFEEAGKFLAGRVLSQTDSSLQVDLESGKRLKVKAANALLSFEQPSPTELITVAQALSQEIDLNLAWECASEDEFGFADLAQEYFSSSPNTRASVQQQTACLFALFAAPHYFRRCGKGRFKKADAAVVAQALAALEKKAALTAQIDAWANELIQGACPLSIREQLYSILFKPDKNSPEYKAVVQACRSTQTAPLVLLQKVGAIASPYQFHWQRFLLENFPKGADLPSTALPAVQTLPLASTQAFSIDDSGTTEIDDALSVQGLGSGTVTLGIHIAVPALSVYPGDALDASARQRMSTVYMPGHKLTMLPKEVVQAHSLQEGRHCPALSLYLTLDEVNLTVQAHSTRLEQVSIASNLRYDQLEDQLNEAFFLNANDASNSHTSTDIAWASELKFLHRLALHLKAQREAVRGKPETFNRPDFNFKLDLQPHQAPTGEERVHIHLRQRGAPLDLIVAETMILANSTWGQWLAEYGVPGIYRSQAALGAGFKVRMGTKALPHAGLGVASYAWCTSPLRRYSDLVNQWQIMACAQHGTTAALAAPFKPKDADLFAIISAFDAASDAYHSFQASMERYWTLKYLAQNQLSQLTAVTLKDKLVRAEELPLVFSAHGAENLPRGTRVRIQLNEADLLALDIAGTVIEQLDMNESSANDAPTDEDNNADALVGSVQVQVVIEP